jgi:hypothetical protein
MAIRSVCAAAIRSRRAITTVHTALAERAPPAASIRQILSPPLLLLRPLLLAHTSDSLHPKVRIQQLQQPFALVHGRRVLHYRMAAPGSIYYISSLQKSNQRR